MKINDNNLIDIETQYREFLKHIKPVRGNVEHVQYDDSQLLEVVSRVQKICPSVSAQSISSELLDLSQNLCRSAISNQPSQSDTKSHFTSISEAIGNTDITKPLENMIFSLQASVQEFQAVLFLSGISLEQPQVSIGDYELYQGAHGPLPDWIDRNRQYFADIAREHYLKAKCYVIINDLKGDGRFVFEEAPNKAQPIVDILNFFLASCRLRRFGFHKIDVGENPAGRMTIFSQNVLGSLFINESATSIIPYTLNAQLIGEWKDLGLEEVLECYKTKGEASVRSRIRRAIHWYSKAMNADSEGEQFVNLTIALESLLLSDESKNPHESQGGISQKLADRVAFLIGKKKDERIKYKGATKRLYDLRSKVVHSGKTVGLDELDTWDSIVHRTILAMLKHKFSSWDSDFLKWMEDNIYS